MQSESTEIYSLSRTQVSDDYQLRDPSGSSVMIGSLESLISKAKRLRIETVMNVTGSVRKTHDLLAIRDLVDTNIRFSLELAEFAVQIGAKRYIDTSTFSWSMNGEHYSPQSLYAATKFATETVLQFFTQQGLIQVISLEPYDLYGPAQKHKRIFHLLAESLAEGTDLRLHGRGEQEVWPLFVDDAAAGYLHAANLPDQHLSDNFASYTLPGSEVLSVLQLANRMSLVLQKPWVEGQLLFGLEPPNNVIQHVCPPRPNLPNWKPTVSLDTGLARTFNRQ